MTNREKIINFLKRHPEGIDDDDLSVQLQVFPRQQVNQICRKLEKRGLVIRRSKHGKIHNFWNEIAIPNDLKANWESCNNAIQIDDDEPWHWEGNVQSVLVKKLVRDGFKILSVADTAKKTPGKDVIAEKEGVELWVTVKGYPKKTSKTSAPTQASHWFKDAIFDVIKYREEGKHVDIGAAFPDYPTYRRLAEKIAWLESAANFQYFWIKE